MKKWLAVFLLGVPLAVGIFLALKDQRDTAADDRRRDAIMRLNEERAKPFAAQDAARTRQQFKDNGYDYDAFIREFNTVTPAAAPLSAKSPAAAPAKPTESLLTVPAGKFTPAQIEMARRDIEFTKSITKWEESSTGAYITFRYGNYNPDRIQLYRRAEMIVIGDQASTGKIRYLTFYDPTNKKVATFSPAFGLKLIE